MTYKECVIVSAYTGYMLCDFDDLHKYIEEKLCRPVWSHELANSDVIQSIRDAVRPEFLALAQHKPEATDVPKT